ncbi:type II toxin-antitoxin system Phd/YefM family antitoxin [Paramicrobacterium agarici]|uniref:Antitoxin n=1 Tax=Paramicrobacterium agarici TaxID=630514 RepID=A0A2A9DSG3_9MICO|nr:type II toxin-antitoxin system prevent-host-death family antitoxin [Microbacterium agarici]PFG29524.1 prevent-host-death family protein [Microbacterium agarici]
MAQTVPIGKLRQNPTEVLRAVAAGQQFVITNHRVPVANLVPYRESAGISGPELMRRLRQVHDDETWNDELHALRETETGRDPWQ